MKLTNTVYRYAIRKLKVGTASVAVAALMFLGSGNAVVNAADLNQQSALVAKASSPEITQVKEASPTEDNLKSDLEEVYSKRRSSMPRTGRKCFSTSRSRRA